MSKKGDVSLNITGDDTGLITALDEAAAAVTEKVGEMKETFANVDEGINGMVEGFGAFAAIFAGGELANHQAAATETGVSADTLNTAIVTLQGRMAQAAEAGGTTAARFTALGITMKEMRDPSFSVTDALAKMGDASNSNAALMAVLGARGATLIPLMRQLAQNHDLVAEAAKRVGALLPGEIDALQRYKDGTALLGVEFDNLKGHIGAYVAESAGPLMSALEGVTHGFAGTVDATIPLKIAFGTLEAAVVVIVDAFKTLEQAVVDSVRDSVDVVAGLGTVIEDVFTGSWQKTETDAKAAYSVMKDDGVKTFTDLGSNLKDTFSGVVQSYEAAWKGASASASTELAAPKVKPNALADLAPAHMSQSEQLANMLAELGNRVEASTEQTQRRILADTATSVRAREALEMSATERQIAGVQAAYRAHQISAGQELTQTEQLLGPKWSEQQTYYARLRTLYAGNQSELTRLYAQEEKDHQTYLSRLQTAQDTYSMSVTRSWEQIGKTVRNYITQAFNGVLQGTETMTQAMAGMFEKMGVSIVETLVKIEVQKAVMSALGIAQNKEEAHSDAAAAAAGAAKSAAQIPYVGWILAPAAAASVYAMASGFSAEGGFDIPAGLNPKTQLHEREMVLPQKYADVIRGMGDEEGGAGGDVHLHVHATDSDSVERLFSRHGDVLASTLRQLHRDGKL